MRKIVKTCFVFVTVFALLSLSVFSVSAESSSCLFSPTTFQLLEIYASNADDPNIPPASYSWTSNDKGYGILSLTTDASYLSTWSAKFKPLSKAGDLVVRDNYDLNAGFYFRVTGVGSSFMNQDITGAMYITSPDGTVYQFPITYINPVPDSSQIYLQVGGTVSTKNSFHFSDCIVELRFSCLSAIRGVNLTFTTFNLTALEYITGNTAHIVESVEKGFADLQAKQEELADEIISNQDWNTDKIIGNQNANANKITQNQDENTDKITGSIEDSTDQITNGWGTDDDTAGKTDDAVNGLGSAEDEALGGKSDEEIKAEVNNALGQVTFPDQKPDNIIKVGAMFNDLLDVFGAQYQSLLILSLSLGLGAFLVGRQYKAKG